MTTSNYPTDEELQFAECEIYQAKILILIYALMTKILSSELNQLYIKLHNSNSHFLLNILNAHFTFIIKFTWKLVYHKAMFLPRLWLVKIRYEFIEEKGMKHGREIIMKSKVHVIVHNYLFCKI